MKINIKKWTSNKNISFLFKILEKKDEETKKEKNESTNERRT